MTAEQGTFLSCDGGTYHCGAAKSLLLVALCGIVCQSCTTLPCQVLLEAIALNGCCNKDCFIEALYLLLLFPFVTFATGITIAALSGTV